MQYLQQANSSFCDLKLQAMDGDRRLEIPALPNPRVLACCAVSRTRDVAKDSVEVRLARRSLTTLRWKNLRFVVGGDEARRGEAGDLMHQEKGALLRGIIGHNDAGRNPAGFAGAMQRLDELCCLGARRGTHIEDAVMRLNVKKQRRNHAHELLTIEELVADDDKGLYGAHLLPLGD